MDEKDYRACCDKLETHLQEVYGIPVVVRDIPPPFTGDLDGSEIDVDFETSPADRLFLILHLFGHTVQWNVNPRAREIGSPAAVPVDEQRLPELAAYEREAGGYALSLLHHVGITDLDRWLSDLTASDLAYLLHYYRTGERKSVREFFMEGTPLIQAIPIPHFRPAKWVFRSDGVVI
jgi:hypothetical protein